MAVCARRGGARPLCDVETTLARRGEKAKWRGYREIYLCRLVMLQVARKLGPKGGGGSKGVTRAPSLQPPNFMGQSAAFVPPTAGSRSGLGFGSCGSETWGEKHEAHV